MSAAPAADAPFDPRWLELLAESCQRLGRTSPRLCDLYLEHRLELEVSGVDGLLHGEECRTQGAAARWAFPRRTVLHASTGASPQTVNELLERYGPTPVAAATRALPPTELDAPRGWQEWARDLVRRLTPPRASVRFLIRKAVVIRPGSWTVVVSPPLVRARVFGDYDTALLAVWDHPQLAHWLSELAEPPAKRRWAPGSATQVPVVFTAGTAGVLLHELVGHLVEADLAGTGSSPLMRLKGASMTAASVQLVDDATRLDLPGGFSCDDEGTPARPLEIIRAGVLVGWLCDLAGAERLGAEPGRGRRASWRHPPGPRLSNLVVSPGDTEPEALEHDLKQGLVVTRLAGATVDPVSGRTVVRVERGWEVANGRRRRPLRPFELTGGALEVLANIDPNLGRDMVTDWRLGWCVKGGLPLPTGSLAPTMLVRRLEVL